MIVRSNKLYETNSLYPNSDWYKEENFVIDETTEEGKLLSERIKNAYPRYHMVIVDNKLVDILEYQQITLTTTNNIIFTATLPTGVSDSEVRFSLIGSEEVFPVLVLDGVAEIDFDFIEPGEYEIKAESDNTKPATIKVVVA